MYARVLMVGCFDIFLHSMSIFGKCRFQILQQNAEVVDRHQENLEMDEQNGSTLFVVL